MNSVQTAVVLAAGFGTRLRPLTDTIPKAMVEVGGRPLLEKVVSEIVASNIPKIVFVVGHLGDQIEKHFGTGVGWSSAFSYIHQQTLNGTGGALLQAQASVDGNFVVVFGDSLFDGRAIKRVAEARFRNAIGVIRVPDPSRYGIVEVDSLGRVVSIVEKPENPKGNLAIAGIYKFEPDIWFHLRSLKPSKRGELEIPDSVRSLMSSGADVGTVELEFMTDVGTHEDLQRVRLLASSGSLI